MLWLIGEVYITHNQTLTIFCCKEKYIKRLPIHPSSVLMPITRCYHCEYISILMVAFSSKHPYIINVPVNISVVNICK